MLIGIFLTENFQNFLLGDVEWGFIPEIALRTLIMYLILLFSLRVLGKRGVKQLSVFELVVIISLGSAAGDPMFYQEVGILAALTVFVVVVVAYKLTSLIVNRSKKAEQILEGKATYLIENGMFSIENFKKETLAQDEFFSELRFQGVSHLGQVELAIIETSGSVSLFYYSDDLVKYGLPILPHLFCEKHIAIIEKAYYSCSFCGFTEELIVSNEINCKRCKKTKWVKSLATKRIT
ncbi:DUF421 domain-containing protein [Pedobacter cryotolerans]|uniref:DUF421 domain-containing protein n=1 Tax=Pedobacter cryotolerans TaxID=2571270 RepID=UPI00145DE1CD|nr:YetF domain-containing protein [Pedobacter cryotolerans]